MTTRYWKLCAQWSGYGIGLGLGPDGERGWLVQRAEGPQSDDVLATLIVRPQQPGARGVEEELGARADDVGERFVDRARVVRPPDETSLGVTQERHTPAFRRTRR